MRLRSRVRPALWAAALGALTTVGSLAHADPIVPPPPPVYLPLYPPLPGTSTPVPGDMPYYGGKVLLHPRVYLVFWGWHSRRDVSTYLTRFFRGIGGSPWLGVLTQYYDIDDSGHRQSVSNDRGQLGGVWFDSRGPTHDNLEALDIQAEASKAEDHFRLQVGDDVVVVVATPPYASTSDFNQGKVCAWHSYDEGFAYVDLPFQPKAGTDCGARSVNAGGAGALDGVSIVAGHEYLEAITDPGAGMSGPGTGWRDLLGDEAGDKCSWVRVGNGALRNITLTTGTFAVQSIWDNNANDGLGDCTFARS